MTDLFGPNPLDLQNGGTNKMGGVEMTNPFGPDPKRDPNGKPNGQ